MAKHKKLDTVSKILLIIIAVLVFLIVLYSIRTYSHYQVLRSHRAYLRQPHAAIQPWMTITTLTRHYNITTDVIQEELGVNATRTTTRQTIQTICDKNQLDCTQVVARLNSRLTR